MLNEYGYPVMFSGDLNLSDQSFLPDSDMPGLTSERDLDKRVNTETQDPDVDPITNRARNSDLELLRSMHPFVTIDPPFVDSLTVNLNFSDGEFVVSIPTNCVMYRITHNNSAAATALIISSRRGIQTVFGTSGSEGGVVMNPPPVWRYCKGQSELVLKNTGVAGRVLVSVEFFCQL